MKYRQFRIRQAVSFTTNIPTYSHKGHPASRINPNITTNKKTQQQKEIHPALDKNYTERMKQNKKKKSKVKFLLTNIKDRKIGNRPLHMEKLNRYQVSTIFKARTRMLDVKTTSEENIKIIYAEAVGPQKKHKNMY